MTGRLKKMVATTLAILLVLSYIPFGVNFAEDAEENLKETLKETVRLKDNLVFEMGEKVEVDRILDGIPSLSDDEYLTNVGFKKGNEGGLLDTSKVGEVTFEIGVKISNMSGKILFEEDITGTAQIVMKEKSATYYFSKSPNLDDRNTPNYFKGPIGFVKSDFSNFGNKSYLLSDTDITTEFYDSDKNRISKDSLIEYLKSQNEIEYNNKKIDPSKAIIDLELYRVTEEYSGEGVHVDIKVIVKEYADHYRPKSPEYQVLWGKKSDDAVPGLKARILKESGIDSEHVASIEILEFDNTVIPYSKGGSYKAKITYIDETTDEVDGKLILVPLSEFIDIEVDAGYEKSIGVDIAPHSVNFDQWINIQKYEKALQDNGIESSEEGVLDLTFSFTPTSEENTYSLYVTYPDGSGEEVKQIKITKKDDAGGSTENQNPGSEDQNQQNQDNGSGNQSQQNPDGSTQDQGSPSVPSLEVSSESDDDSDAQDIEELEEEPVALSNPNTNTNDNASAGKEGEQTEASESKESEIVDLEEEATPLGNGQSESEGKDGESKDAAASEIIDLEEEAVALGTASQGAENGNLSGVGSETLISMEEEAVALGSGSLPYTGQTSYTYFTALGGILVSLGLLLKRIVRK